MVKDVVIKPGEFICFIDFIILETELTPNTWSQIFVILGWWVLTISTALINCRRGLIKPSFGMSVALNIFNMDEYTTNSLIEINMVHKIYTNTTSCANVELIFEQFFFKDINKLAHQLHVWWHYLRLSLANKPSFGDLFVEELELFHKLEESLYFTVYNSLDHGVRFTCYSIPTCILDDHMTIGILTWKFT